MPIETSLSTEIWLRPHPWATLSELEHLLAKKIITATPRAGTRDAGHPKGYQAGQSAFLRLLDASGQAYFAAPIRITNVAIRRLKDISKADLAGCGPCYRTWRDVLRVLNFFEKRWLEPEETITVVRFEYL